jgi:hypothetical protein
LAGDGPERTLGVVLQLDLALLEALVGANGRGGAEHIA